MNEKTSINIFIPKNTDGVYGLIVNSVSDVGFFFVIGYQRHFPIDLFSLLQFKDRYKYKYIVLLLKI